MSKPKFEAQGYVKTTRMGEHGEKLVTFEFASSETLEVARLELMSRNQADPNKTPLLLKVKAEVVFEKERPTIQETHDFT